MPDDANHRHDEPGRWASLSESAQGGAGGPEQAAPEVPGTTGVVGINVEHDMPIGGGSEPVGESPDRASRLPPLSPVPVALTVLAVLILLMAIVLGIRAFA